MKNTKLKVAGFGGQGVMMFGQILAYAAVEKNLNSLWFPSYGPETRGGTANCSVIISSDPIDSPVFKNADYLIAFNGPSLDKFINNVEANGYILYNSSLIKETKVPPPGVKIYGIPVNDIANELGLIQIANMVMLGAFLELSGALDDEVIIKLIKKTLGERKAHLVDVNIQAIQRGREMIKKVR